MAENDPFDKTYKFSKEKNSKNTCISSKMTKSTSTRLNSNEFDKLETLCEG